MNEGTGQLVICLKCIMNKTRAAAVTSHTWAYAYLMLFMLYYYFYSGVFMCCLEEKKHRVMKYALL